MEFYAEGKLYKVVFNEDEIGADIELMCDGKLAATLLLGHGGVASIILPGAIVLPRAGETVH